jgi:molybdopterin molybdotransferase
MLSAQFAETLILDLVHPLDPQQDAETVDLLSAAGRVLAQLVTSQLDFPHWDNSAMDGYAVRYADVQACSAEHPVRLTIVEEIPAGSVPQKMIQAGEAARILTGSMMPPGADTVIMQEEVQRAGDRLIISSSPKYQAFVRHRGEFYQAGQPLLPAGIVLSAPEIAVLAAAQCPRVAVYRRPRVAILSTGSELVSPDQPLQPGQIVDSNQYALSTLVAQSGAKPLPLGVIPDQPKLIREAIAHAIASADIVLSSGGVSVGDYDYIDEILSELGAEIHIRSVAIRPGKPLTVATFSHPTPQSNPATFPPKPVLYFGLPGNPVSALVSFWRFVQPALRKLSGLQNCWSPSVVSGQIHQEMKSDGKRETYLWGQTYLVNGKYEFHLSEGSHSSGNLINLAQTNSLAIVPIGRTSLQAGDSIQIMLVKSPAIPNSTL